MCSIIGEFKLCTCSKKIDKSKPYWVIERLLVDENEIYPVCIGMHAGGYLNNIDSILDKLNNGNPFDFEYNPESNDILELNFEEVVFNLIYRNGRWEDFCDDYEALDKNEKKLLLKGKMEADYLHKKLTFN